MMRQSDIFAGPIFAKYRHSTIGIRQCECIPGAGQSFSVRMAKSVAAPFRFIECAEIGVQ